MTPVEAKKKRRRWDESDEFNVYADAAVQDCDAPGSGGRARALWAAATGTARGWEGAAGRAGELRGWSTRRLLREVASDGVECSLPPRI